MESHVSQNYSVECGIAVNTVANLEMHASLVYLSMAYYFDRDDVALSQFAKLFKARSEKMWEAAENFLRYQNKRGGRIVLQDIKKPERDEWRNCVEALETALNLEKRVNQALLSLHKLVLEKSDPHLCDFLEWEYLDQQVKVIKCLGDHITNLMRLGAPLGQYLFDRLTLEDSS
ncbi:ferritin heavy chain B-like isoform X1 [Tachyglossus aculeatus]|uniref:ferritin heavy chain B-like isoform X1 n=1 Tax=Tachyglossus aculeatus TaxID=9261 RepID=UPI0018F5C7B6|nr:ferritin heavy chain B-like isoform X1 [Tachyglossus aculeatus]